MMKIVKTGLLARRILSVAVHSAVIFSWLADDASADPPPDRYRVYVGTYTRGQSDGIYVFEMDAKTGDPTEPRLAAMSDNPSFLAIHPSGRYLYAANEISNFGGEKAGAASAFVIGADGGLKLLNQQSSGGAGPCHLVVDPSGKNVLLANYGGGSVACLPIQEDGRLGEASSFVQHTGSSIDPRRQSGPHAHSINTDSEGKYAFAADLGLDKVLIYRLDADRGTLEPGKVPLARLEGGAGPRHFVFHPSGNYAYVNNEMTSSVTAFAYDSKQGALNTLQTLSTLPEETPGNSTAEIRVHPSGKFLYVSNRGHDSIAIFSIDSKTGKLAAVGHEPTQGKTPRNFNLDPSGAFLLAENQNSGSIVIFKIDPETGKLTPTGHTVNVSSPVCVRMLPLSE